MRVINFVLSALLFLLLASPEASGDTPNWHPKITQVFVVGSENPTSIMIIGDDLLRGSSSPSVTLGEFGNLVITGTPTETLIEAMLPALITDGQSAAPHGGGGIHRLLLVH